MTPEDIVSDLRKIGVYLYAEGDRIAAMGTLPSDWIERAGKLLPYKQLLLEHLQKQARPTPEPQHMEEGTWIVGKVSRPALCKHAGFDVVEYVKDRGKCGACSIRKCALHGLAMHIGRLTNRPDVHPCQTCPDYEKRTA